VKPPPRPERGYPRSERKGAGKASLEKTAPALPGAIKRAEGRPAVKTVAAPDKLINIVVNSGVLTRRGPQAAGFLLPVIWPVLPAI
jgi:hypothetical protein